MNVSHPLCCWWLTWWPLTWWPLTWWPLTWWPLTWWPLRPLADICHALRTRHYYPSWREMSAPPVTSCYFLIGRRASLANGTCSQQCMNLCPAQVCFCKTIVFIDKTDQQREGRTFSIVVNKHIWDIRHETCLNSFSGDLIEMRSDLLVWMKQPVRTATCNASVTAIPTANRTDKPETTMFICT